MRRKKGKGVDDPEKRDFRGLQKILGLTKKIKPKTHFLKDANR